MAKEKTDSVNDMEARKAKIKAEADEIEKSQSEEEARQRQARIDRDLVTSEAQAKTLEHHAGLVHDGETREQLLDRVRALREAPAAPAYVPPPPTAFQQQQINAEQEAGRDHEQHHDIGCRYPGLRVLPKQLLVERGPGSTGRR